jgi:uncharacterized protein YuzE
MRIRYDSEVDALSILFLDTTVTTQELQEGINVEYDAQGQLVGLEILDASKRFNDPSALQQIILEGIGPALALASTQP